MTVRASEPPDLVYISEEIWRLARATPTDTRWARAVDLSDRVIVGDDDEGKVSKTRLCELAALVTEIAREGNEDALMLANEVCVFWFHHAKQRATPRRAGSLRSEPAQSKGAFYFEQNAWRALYGQTAEKKAVLDYLELGSDETVRRWLRGETTPRPRVRKLIKERWNIPTPWWDEPYEGDGPEVPEATTAQAAHRPSRAA